MIAGPTIALAAVLLALGLTGCGGPRPAGPSTQRDEPTSVVPQPRIARHAVDEAALPEPGSIALRYALAARSWTASSYRAQHRRQVRLAGGELRRALEDAAPTRRQIAGYRADHARLEARALAVSGGLRSSTQAEYRITLDERSTAAGRMARQRATYLTELHRRSGRWLVVTFTAEP